MTNLVVSQWEIRSFPVYSIKGSYDIAIVMGGSSRYYDDDAKRLVYGSGVDRIIQANELYKKKKVKKILLTGGSGFVMSQEMKEAQFLKQLLINMNVHDQDIMIENESRNTYENAKMAARLLGANLSHKRIIVITSAYHMRRTMACFKKQGILADMFPVDEHSFKTNYSPDKLFIPDTGSVEKWEMIIHEWIGCITYKLSGYI